MAFKMDDFEDFLPDHPMDYEFSQFGAEPDTEDWRPPKRKSNYGSRKIPRTRGKAKEEAETISNYHSVISKNESLKVECKELKNMNKKLLEQNAKLLNELKRVCKSSESVEAFNNSIKRDQRSVGVVLTTETLLTLWNDISKINLPECDCTED